MNTKEIQKLICINQVMKYHNPVCENVKFLFSDFELDVLSVSKVGMVYEFEVKISRGDFKADAKKRKHQFYQSHINNSPNYFSYVCPKDLISKNEIAQNVGLYYIIDNELVEIQSPKRRHNTILDKTKIMEKVCRVTSERNYLGACRLTFENKKLHINI